MLKSLKRYRDWLVPGMIPGPQPRSEGRSRFYPDAMEQIASFHDDRDGLPSPVQERGFQDIRQSYDDIELSDVSVTSEHVQTVSNERITPMMLARSTQVCTEPYYSYTKLGCMCTCIQI